MKDFIESFVNKKPDQLVLHIGTNGLQKELETVKKPRRNYKLYDIQAKQKSYCQVYAQEKININ